MSFENLENVQTKIGEMFDYIAKYYNQEGFFTADITLKIWDKTNPITLNQQFKITPINPNMVLKDQS